MHGQLIPLLYQYVLNAAALSKPYAIEHLTAQLIYLATVPMALSVITETHVKANYADSTVAIHSVIYLLITRIKQ